MGLFSFIGSLLGGGSQKKAVTQATNAQVDAYNKGIGEEQRQFDLTRSDFEPYLKAGTGALGQLGDLVGTNGAPQQQSAIDALKASPFYQTLFRTGEENVLQNASATGGLRGGNTERGLADFGSDTLMKTIQQQLSSLGGIAGMGEGATNSVAGFGASNADAITKLLGSIGGAQASGILTKAGIGAQGLQNAGGFLDTALSSILGGGSLKSILGKIF
jgi:hypothetical protein